MVGTAVGTADVGTAVATATVGTGEVAGSGMAVAVGTGVFTGVLAGETSVSVGALNTGVGVESVGWLVQATAAASRSKRRAIRYRFMPCLS